MRSFNCPLIHATFFCIEFLAGQLVHHSVKRLPFSGSGAEGDAPIAGDTGVEEGDPASLRVVASDRFARNGEMLAEESEYWEGDEMEMWGSEPVVCQCCLPLAMKPSLYP